MQLYQRRTKRRLFYTSGLISLVLLPLLCFWFIKPEKWLSPRTTMEINLPDKPTHDKSLIFYNNDFSNRSYHTINLTGNEANDKIKLQYAQLELRRMLSEDDSIHGLHVKISDKAKYWAMVEIFDICNIESVNYYGFDIETGDFWALHKPKPLHINTELPFYYWGTKMYVPNNNDILFNQINIISEDFKLFFQHIKFIWPSVILFLTMLFLISWKFIKK